MSVVKLRRIYPSAPGGDAALDQLCRRAVEASPEVEAQVRAIIDDVRARGDAAVREYTERFDGRAPHAGDSYEVERDRLAAAHAGLPPAVRGALERAARRIADFHRLQGGTSYAIDRGQLGLRAQPLGRVGLYAPGGTARYPSSVLMTAIPARLAGVREIILCTPGASAETLAAAHLAGVHRVYELGGAQAVAALAYGTATVPRVDKIVGPGNQWVAAAKRLVFGAVDIDSIAGPSEVLIVADRTADPRYVAADLLAQAEHDVEARPILVATDDSIVDAVDAALTEQLAALSRVEIAGTSLARHGVAVVVGSVEEAFAVAEAYAPEHLELMIERAGDRAAALRSAGAIFVGGMSPEAAGDYSAGPNHVLPTAGAARYASPLGVYDFIKYVSILQLDVRGLREIADDVEQLAAVEGLDAHGRSIAIRRDALSAGGDAPRGRPAPATGREERWRELVREDLAPLSPYRVSDPPALVAKLDANEHPFALPPDEMAELAAELAALPLNRYPDIEAAALRDAVAADLGVKTSQLLIGCGSDEVIALMCATFARPRPGRARAAIAFPTPSFAMFPVYARAAGCVPVELPLHADFTLDLPAIDAALGETRPNLCFFARPNNPTGTLWPSSEIAGLCARHPGTLFVSDEAYAAYASDSMLEQVFRLPNLVALQTLSKIGLAALRVGFLIAPAPIIDEVEKIRGPYNVGALNQVAARWALTRCRDLIRERCAVVVAERARLSAALAAMPGVAPFASEANFILFRVGAAGDRQATELWRSLMTRGIAIKNFDRPGPLEGCLRATLGTPEENDGLIAAMREHLG